MPNPPDSAAEARPTICRCQEDHKVVVCGLGTNPDCPYHGTHITGCEKCWGDAFVRARTRGGHQVEWYRIILHERRNNPCTEAEQDGN